MTLTLYYHETSLAHDTGAEHPENIRRMEALRALFGEEPYKNLPRGAVQKAAEEQILRAHPYTYLQKLQKAVPQSGYALLDADTILSPASLDAAFYAAGAACAAVDDVMEGKTRRAFCAVRPPGHHAEPERAMGFCLFNNIFIAARHAQEAHGTGKIAIVDFDVHHGNGTDAMTRRHDGSIFFISSHQHPLWPMTGLEEDNEDCVMNLILPAASGSERFRTLYETKVFPALNRFAPELVLISAGFDAHRDDPLAQLALETEDFGWVTRELCAIADRHAQGRVISVLEGGYNIAALRESVAAHLDGLRPE